MAMRVWDSATYESSLLFGQSEPITITLGGGTSVPADLAGMRGFTFAMPEPSTLALGMLGVAFLCWRLKRDTQSAAASN